MNWKQLLKYTVLGIVIVFVFYILTGTFDTALGVGALVGYMEWRFGK